MGQFFDENGHKNSLFFAVLSPTFTAFLNVRTALAQTVPECLKS